MTNNIKRNPMKGEVISVSSDKKTVKVQVPRVVAHANYNKRMHLVSEIWAHSVLADKVQPGCQVEILPCRPMSKTKSWRVVSVCG